MGESLLPPYPAEATFLLPPNCSALPLYFLALDLKLEVSCYLNVCLNQCSIRKWHLFALFLSPLPGAVLDRVLIYISNGGHPLLEQVNHQVVSGVSVSNEQHHQIAIRCGQARIVYFKYGWHCAHLMLL